MDGPKTAQQKRRAIRSRWWRRPLEALFSDKVFDGQFQNGAADMRRGCVWALLISIMLPI